MRISIEKTKQPKKRPTEKELADIAFGTTFTDHMLLIDYNEGRGWHDARIVPYGPLSLQPASTCLHYGQLIFEGLKAYRARGGSLVMFRPDQNMARMNSSCERMCIPKIDEREFAEAIAKLVETDEEWVPSLPATSLYIRPFIISNDAFLGVHPSSSYMFIVILCPVGAYYKEGLAPVKIYVEDEYVRAVKGGTGFAKCAGNYAASLKSQVEASEKGYSQVLWLDGVERRNIEEVGAMNVFFVIDGEITTPELNGSILPGITRKSVIELARSWNVPVAERRIAIDELAAAHSEGKVSEAFGAGTAAVISPIGEMKWKNAVMRFNDGKIGEISQRLYDEITGIQTGAREDKFGWVHKIK
ncbi:MAG: branched-chain amino acid aminotransferase [Synergistaceae bacterium]|jgi:branched-chain amino acid aminotransferase|nr:branched-chain amino acid aminotransferase [Synergistaceae bacterium]